MAFSPLLTLFGNGAGRRSERNYLRFAMFFGKKAGVKRTV
ncbi:hypothetical protein HMPREF0574_1712 [Mobiluncus curtisii subsp. curtisii ATCC 35241]|nr:hypothetical protein HMPREF0574_1712 [Mobiluncus curtisii subsp. curtisii ATCC 35241]